MRWLGLVLLAAPAAAQDLPFQPDRIESCLAAGGGQDCIGLAADFCASTPDGGTTVGLGFCFGRERDWWDARLNTVYGDLMEQERTLDAENESYGLTLPSRAEALRAMQRAWITYRDAACEYEYTQWGGGTGGNPAHAACTMRETAEQALELEARLRR